jgi:heme exporter protein D
MTPDLGPYAGAVLGAYGVTLGLLAGLVLLSALRAAAVRRALARLEQGRGREDG